jgi:hypothetical protein
VSPIRITGQRSPATRQPVDPDRARQDAEEASRMSAERASTSPAPSLLQPSRDPLQEGLGKPARPPARKPRRARGKRPGVYVRLTPELKEQLDAFCARAGVSMNSAVSSAVAFLVRA